VKGGGGEDDETCVSFGCDREARNDEHCEPCRTAFEAGYHKAQEDNGVRGREEIREVYETAEDLDEALQREISTLERDKEAAQVPTPTITNTIRILKDVRRRVLGERDEL
jgi:hypothetical protein